jgi:hypothetical protein
LESDDVEPFESNPAPIDRRCPTGGAGIREKTREFPPLTCGRNTETKHWKQSSDSSQPKHIHGNV